MSIERLVGIKAVIFDFDDTLVNCFTPKSAQHKLVAKSLYGISLADETVREKWGLPFNKLISQLYGFEQDNCEEMQRAKDEIVKTYSHSSRKCFTRDQYPCSMS